MATIESDDGYRNIGHWLWAKCPRGGNLELHTGMDEKSDYRARVVVQRADIENLVELLREAGHLRETPQGGAAEREQVIRLLADRVEALENSSRRGFEDLRNRANQISDVVTNNHRAQNVAQEKLGERIDQVEVRISDIRRVDWLESKQETKARIDALEAVDEGLGRMVREVAGVVERLQDLVEKRLGDAKPDVIASDLATRDYVDQGLKRLSAALRDHVAKVIAEAIRAAAPGPGLLSRIRDAVKPTVGYRPSSFPRAVDPEKASAVGAAAARTQVVRP